MGMAQLLKAPALTLLNVPAGALFCPSLLRPKQVMVPSGRSPQTWKAPELTLPVAGARHEGGDSPLVAATVKVWVPDCVGAPESWPCGLSVSPGGSLPSVTVKVGAGATWVVMRNWKS